MAGELPVMLPEKLQKLRMIAEMESVEGGATDLTGDSGVAHCRGLSSVPLLACGRVIAEHSARGSSQHKESITMGGQVVDATSEVAPFVMAGAVGRVLVHGEDGHHRVQFDLKGKQYHRLAAAQLAQFCGQFPFAVAGSACSSTCQRRHGVGMAP